MEEQLQDSKITNYSVVAAQLQSASYFINSICYQNVKLNQDILARKSDYFQEPKNGISSKFVWKIIRMAY